MKKAFSRVSPFRCAAAVMLVLLAISSTTAFAADIWVSQLSPAGIGRPQGVLYTRAAFDPLNGRMLLAFGTTDSQCATSLNQVFGLDVTGQRRGLWYRMNLNPAPDTRSSEFLVFDAAGHRIIMFGGSDPLCNPLTDAWELDLTKGAERWSRLNISGTPPPQSRHGYVVYDTGVGRILYFGGEQFFPTETYSNSTYQLMLSGSQGTWTRLQPAGDVPSPRSQGIAAYDSKAHRMYVFGGGVNHYSGVRRFFDDVYSMSTDPGTERWEKLAGAGPNPAARAGCIAEYVPTQKSFVVFGGGNYSGGSAGFNDFYILSTASTANWTVPAVHGTSLPGARWNLASAYDSVNDRVLLFGGGRGAFSSSGGWSAWDDLWEVSFQDPNQITPVPTATPVPQATPTPVPGGEVVSLRSAYDAVGQSVTLDLRVAQGAGDSPVVTLYAGLELQGGFYFLPNFTTGAASLFGPLTITGNMDTGWIPLLALGPIAPLGTPIDLHWYAALIDSQGRLYGSLASASVTLP